MAEITDKPLPFAIDVVRPAANPNEAPPKPRRLFNLSAELVNAVLAAEAAADAPKPSPNAPPPERLPTDGPVVEPGQSIEAALRAAKLGTSVYLRRGGVWPALNLDPSVRLKGVRITDYGNADAATPMIFVESGKALLAVGWDQVTIDGVDFAAKEPTDSALEFVDCGFTKLVDVAITGYRTGVTFDGRTMPAGLLELVAVTITDCCGRTGDSHGVNVLNAKAPKLDGCLIQRIGWSEKFKPNNVAWRCHAVYTAGNCVGPTVATSCVFADCAGPAVQLRSGGWVTSCRFVRNPEHLQIGLVNGDGPVAAVGVPALVRDNVFVGTRLYPGGGLRGSAIVLGNCHAVEIVDNRFAYAGKHPNAGGFGSHVKVDVGAKNDGSLQPGRKVTGVIKLNRGRGACEGVVYDDRKAKKQRTLDGGYWCHPEADVSGLSVQTEWPRLSDAEIAELLK